MPKLVYLIGAGLNQPITDWDGLKPPLANDFFQMALRHHKFADAHYSNRIAPLYEYISHYWKKSKEDLQNQPFNLEERFTMLQLQQNEAERVGDQKKLTELVQIEFQLESFLAEYLSEFDVHALRSDVMRNLGTVIYREKPTILTLNYDCILEMVIEHASGVRTNVPEFFLKPDCGIRVPNDKLLSYSHHNWNRPLGYGIKFDEVQLQQAGPSKYVRGSRFYTQNKLYDWAILKLHGSLNWFHYLPIRKYPALDPKDKKLSEEKLQETILKNGRWWFSAPPKLHGWFLNPLIITPVLYKERFYQYLVFPDIWERAHDELSTCKRLVVIGYSFAPTDFNIRKMY